MVDITLSDDEKYLSASISGDDFSELVQFFKESGASYNAKSHGWEFKVEKYDMIETKLKSMGETISIDIHTKNFIDRQKATWKELKCGTSRRTFHQELMNYPPLPGKHPYEDFQYVDILRALNQNRFLFNWRMGLGKSYTLAALLAHLRYYKVIDKALIFSSNVGVLNVKNELKKFIKDFDENDVRVFLDASEVKYEDRDIFNVEKYPQHTFIMTYDFLKSVSNFYYDLSHKKKRATKVEKIGNTTKYTKNPMPIKEWLGDKEGCLFMDENHLLNNASSRRSQIFKFILPFFEYRYLFTATLATKYEKLYFPSYVLDKSLVGNLEYMNWVSSLNEVGNRFSRYAVNDDKWDLIEIGKLNEALIRNYSSKRGQECLELPDHMIYEPYYLEMSDIQRKIYEMFSNDKMSKLAKKAKEEGKSLSTEMRSMFPYFHLAVDNPSCFKSSRIYKDFPNELKDLIEKYDYNKDSTKLRYVDAVIRDRVDENDEKGIVWFYHPATGQALMERYKKYHPVFMDSSIDKSDRVGVVNEFLHNPKEKLIIASINVMNTSLTLVECSFAVYVEKTYDYNVYDQSLGRIHRPGQTKTVRTYSVRYSKSIDALQELNLKNKGNTLRMLLNKEYISMDIWKNLFNMQQGDTI